MHDALTYNIQQNLGSPFVRSGFLQRFRRLLFCWREGLHIGRHKPMPNRMVNIFMWRPIQRHFLATMLITLAIPSSAGDWSLSYAPTRGEWLQIELTRSIEKNVNLWRTHLSVDVLAHNKAQEIWVMLAVSNGQPEMPVLVCENYKGMIGVVVKNVLKRYEWASDAKVVIGCA